MSISDAFKTSFRPLDIGGDLRALPYLATRTKALWVPVLLTVGTTVALAVTRGTDIVSAFMFSYFIATPAIGGVFIAGFLAPRASWLLGLIVGLIAAVCYIGLGAAGLLPPGFMEVYTADPQAAIVSALTLSPPMGALFAAAAAWYRRFLNLSNPNRGRQGQGKPRRGADGRSRAGGSEKAGARR